MSGEAILEIISRLLRTSATPKPISAERRDFSSLTWSKISLWISLGSGRGKLTAVLPKDKVRQRYNDRSGLEQTANNTSGPRT